MFGQIFYFSTLRKYVILVGALFDDIFIKRFDSAGNETELVAVPITYAPKDKMLARVMQDPGIDRPSAVLPLPCISFEMGELRYDRDRKLNTTGRSSQFDTTSANTFLVQYNPVPYNIEFKVYIYAKNVEDGNKILEQILPYFTPDWTTSVKIMSDMNITMDIPVVLNHVSYTDTYDKEYKERRAIIWTLDLLVKGYFYGPIKHKPVIKFVNTHLYAVGQSDAEAESIPPMEYVVVRPGLTVDGEPTTNASLSVGIGEIWANSDYGYIQNIYHEDGS